MSFAASVITFSHDYRTVGQNLDILQSLTQPTTLTTGKRLTNKTNLNNVLMQLRKSVCYCMVVDPCCSSYCRCIQHPYLISEDIEPRNLAPTEVHEKLISASAKLRFLKMLLPKLKAKGHRVLLFSQASEALSGSLT